MLGTFCYQTNSNCILKNFLLLIGSEKKFWQIERVEISLDVWRKCWLILSARGILVRHVKWLTCGYFPLNVLSWFVDLGFPKLDIGVFEGH